MLRHGVGIVGDIVLEHVFANGVHGGYITIDSLVSGIHIGVVASLVACHPLGMLAAKAVHERISD